MSFCYGFFVTLFFRDKQKRHDKFFFLKTECYVMCKYRALNNCRKTTKFRVGNLLLMSITGRIKRWKRMMRTSCSKIWVSKINSFRKVSERLIIQRWEIEPSIQIQNSAGICEPKYFWDKQSMVRSLHDISRVSSS